MTTKKQTTIFDSIKQPAVIVAIIGVCSGSIGGIYHLIDSNANANAELKVREKYDKILTDYAIVAANCAGK